MPVSKMVGAVCFVSVVLLGWVYLAEGASWEMLTVGLFWGIVGTVAMAASSGPKKE